MSQNHRHCPTCTCSILRAPADSDFMSVAKVVCAHEAVSCSALLSKKRDRPVVKARTMVAQLLRQKGYSLSEIGRFLGRDHSTVIHMLRKPVDRFVDSLVDKCGQFESGGSAHNPSTDLSTIRNGGNGCL